LVASSVIAVAAQRLCRKMCQNCKEPHEVTQSVIDRLGLELKNNTTFYHGKGCNKCNHTGYFGRMGTLEVFILDEQIRELIVKKSSSDEIKEYAISKGMKTLRDNAFEKAAMGLTTVEEVLRITTEE